ncbi:hypothetical protein CYMTET_54821 [Cymbomonas tetramitiformis]|uniref:Secreted protein n=1 Tax=Cymbomonas tetramitiformis TaxID=36881 RepID=A0AAE0BFZ5_9CHLO|nr:hypothetical protein CYMTET_54821 [Cymbomonas tetramitiformis]
MRMSNWIHRLSCSLCWKYSTATGFWATMALCGGERRQLIQHPGGADANGGTAMCCSGSEEATKGTAVVPGYAESGVDPNGMGFGVANGWKVEV